MTRNDRTVIVGLDGVPFGMLRDFAENGLMPNTASLIAEGSFSKMYSSIPEVSSVAWASMITGENPGQHGIFGFMDLFQNSYNMRFPNFSDLKAPPFWDLWPGKSIIVNIPSTYPVRKINGIIISGFVSLDFEKSVYPKSLIPHLKNLDYRIDVDAQKAHSSMDLFLKDLDKTLDARIQAYQYLWELMDWQTFMLVFTGTDRLMHFLWDAYQQKDHKYHNLFLEHFRKIDRAIGLISAGLTDEDFLIVHSDHGFEKLEKDVYISYVLAQNGFLQFKQNEDISLKNICHGTKAFALDPARIYLNLKDKYPCGTLEQEDADEILCELENIFKSLRIDGKKVIRDVYRKEQIYSGPCLDNAPDLVLVGDKGFNLKANVLASELAYKTVFTGKHTQDTAFLLMKGPFNKSLISNTPVISDVKGIVEKSRFQP